MKQSYNDLGSFLDHDKLNSSLSKVSNNSKKRPKYTTYTDKEKPNHHKLHFELPQTIEKSFEVMEPSDLQKDILTCITDSLSQIEILRKTYSNISDERKKYKDIVEWLKHMLSEFQIKVTRGPMKHQSDQHVSQLHNIYSSAIQEIIKQLKEENLEKACVIKISWESVTNLHNTLIGQFQKQLKLQKKSITDKHKLQQQLYDKQIEELQLRLERTIFQLAKRERYFYEVVKDNRILRKRTNKLMDRVQREIQTSSYLKEENVIFYKENERLKLALETEMVEEKYQQVLEKLDDIEKQYSKKKKKGVMADIERELKEKEMKNRNIIEKEINDIIKRVNASDFLDLDMATLPSAEDLAKLYHGISVQTEPFVESIGVNTYLNISKRAVGTQFNSDRVKKLVMTEEVHLMIEPLSQLMKSGEFQNKKHSTENSASDRAMKKGKKSHKDSLSNLHYRPSEHLDVRSAKQNIRNSSTHNFDNKKSNRMSMMKNLLPNINSKQKAGEPSEGRFSSVIHPLSNLSKSNLDFMRSSVNERRDLRKSSFIMKGFPTKVAVGRHKSGEFQEESLVHNPDEDQEPINHYISEKKLSKVKIQKLEEFVEEEDEQLDENEEMPVIKKTQSSKIPSTENRKNKKQARGSKVNKAPKIEPNLPEKVLKEVGNISYQIEMEDQKLIENNSKKSSTFRESQHSTTPKQSKMESNQSNLSNHSTAKNRSPKGSKPDTPRQQSEPIQQPVQQPIQQPIHQQPQTEISRETEIDTKTRHNSISKFHQKTVTRLQSVTKTQEKGLGRKKQTSQLNQSLNIQEIQKTRIQMSTIKYKTAESSKSLYPINRSENKFSFHQSTNASHTRNNTSLPQKLLRSTTQLKTQKSRDRSADKVSEINMIKIFKKINQQILIHKNSLLKQLICFEEFLDMNMTRNYGLRSLTTEMNEKLRASLGKYQGYDPAMQVFKKLIEGQEGNPLSIDYKRHIFRIYILIVQFWHNYSNLDNFQTLCQAFMRDLISSFFNKSKADKIITFFEMIEIDNQYKMFTVMESVIETESQSLAFMNTIYNLQSILSDRHGISSKQMMDIVALIEPNKLELHSKINRIFRYSDSKSKNLPFFNLVMQLNKHNEFNLINLETTIESCYNQIYHSRYSETQLLRELGEMQSLIPHSRWLRVLQCMETDTLRQSQRLLYQLIKLEYSNKLIETCTQELLGDQLSSMGALITETLIHCHVGSV